jgi:predicted transcriptional regulator
MAKQGSSIKLPADVVKRVIRVARKANRNPSDLAAEALHWYLLVREVPEETPTAAELRAIRRGREAFKRGDYITLDELRREENLVRRPHRARAKAS